MESDNRAVYKCVNRRCRDYGREFESASPSDSRAWTGRSVSCSRCGDIAVWLRPLSDGAPAPFTPAPRPYYGRSYYPRRGYRR